MDRAIGRHNPRLTRRSFWIVGLMLGAAIIVAVAWTLMRGLASPNALWTIVQSCVDEQQHARVLPKGCVAVDIKNKVAIVRPIAGRFQFLAVPTIRVTGIEDPQLLQPNFPNYWALAWSAAQKYLPAKVTINRANIGLAVNSLPGRSQNQLHIHISCIRPQVARGLAAQASHIGQGWSLPFFSYSNETYRVMRVDAATLSRVNPFLLLAKSRGDAQDMGLHTLVVTGDSWNSGKKLGFYVLDDSAHDTPLGPDTGHGEDLLDEDCAALMSRE